MPPHNSENSNTSSDGNDRRIRDMLGLVKFCLQSTAKEDAKGTTNGHTLGPLDPERRAWLEEAIKSMTIDTTQQLLENLSLVKETVARLERDPDHNVVVPKTCDAIGVLTDLCEEIDYAADFAKLDGFSIFVPLINSSHEELIVKACELIAALAQNNPICQSMAMTTKTLERLVEFVDLKDYPTYIKARSYALYAISSIIRSSNEVRAYFEKELGGLKLLLELLNHRLPEQPSQEVVTQRLARTSSVGSADGSRSSSHYWWRKLKIRSIFLFRTLCTESREALEHFSKSEAIIMLTEQLKVPHDLEVREHLLNALKAYLDALDQGSKVTCLSLVPNLRTVISNIHEASMKEAGDEYDLTDTRSTCQELEKLIDSSSNKS